VFLFSSKENNGHSEDGKPYWEKSIKNKTPIDTRTPKPYFSSGLAAEIFYVFYVSSLRKFMSTSNIAKINRLFNVPCFVSVHCEIFEYLSAHTERTMY
jgi:hypothetical protein